MLNSGAQGGFPQIQSLDQKRLKERGQFNKISRKIRATNLILEFSQHYDKQSTGSLADLVFRLESLFTGEPINYCGRIFKNGEVDGGK